MFTIVCLELIKNRGTTSYLFNYYCFAKNAKAVFLYELKSMGFGIYYINFSKKQKKKNKILIFSSLLLAIERFKYNE